MEAPKYDRSRVMKMAWSMLRNGKKIGRHVLTFAECIKEAWKNERNTFKREMEFFKLRLLAAAECDKRDAKRNIRPSSSMAFASGSLVNYYANNTYNGD